MSASSSSSSSSSSRRILKLHTPVSFLREEIVGTKLNGNTHDTQQKGFSNDIFLVKHFYVEYVHTLAKEALNEKMMETKKYITELKQRTCVF